MTRKRRLSTSVSISTAVNEDEHCTDTFQRKLSMLISLLYECLALSSSALKRARLQLDHEQTWQKLNTIERELETLVEKFSTNGVSNNTTTEKSFQNLAQLLSDWEKYEEEFDQQLEETFIFDP